MTRTSAVVILDICSPFVKIEMNVRWQRQFAIMAVALTLLEVIFVIVRLVTKGHIATLTLTNAKTLHVKMGDRVKTLLALFRVIVTVVLCPRFAVTEMSVRWLPIFATTESALILLDPFIVNVRTVGVAKDVKIKS